MSSYCFYYIKRLLVAEDRRFEPSVPLATVSLDYRGGEGSAGRSPLSKKARLLFTGGPAVRIPPAPAASPCKPDALDLDRRRLRLAGFGPRGSENHVFLDPGEHRDG